jgi:hypothetical protein
MFQLSADPSTPRLLLFHGTSSTYSLRSYVLGPTLPMRLVSQTTVNIHHAAAFSLLRQLRLLHSPQRSRISLILYVPTKFNLPVIDRMICFDQEGYEACKPKLLLVPLQITLALSHSDSHLNFFKKYNDWIKSTSTFDVGVQFIWITPGERKIIQCQFSPE